LDQFLTLGEPRGRDWPNYLARGFGPDHIPDLIRMAIDPELNQADADSPDVWAPLHAWRTLGQLRAAEAVGPLLRLLHWEAEEHDDWAIEEMPQVFALIGPVALPELSAFLADSSENLHARWVVVDAIRDIALAHPEVRAACVEILTSRLERASEEEPGINAAIIAGLLDLQAVEAAPLIERAFAADQVDETIVGTWEEARFELGLRPDRPTGRSWAAPFDYAPAPTRPAGAHSPKARARERAKTRRKQSRKDRKRNRKK
jgi:hypothetical protein